MIVICKDKVVDLEGIPVIKCFCVEHGRYEVAAVKKEFSGGNIFKISIGLVTLSTEEEAQKLIKAIGLSIASECKVFDIPSWLELKEEYVNGTHSFKGTELINALVDVFEDFLDERNIDIPNSERDDETSAIIYGEDFDTVSAGIEAVLKRTGVIK